jgi:hypothetical protein
MTTTTTMRITPAITPLPQTHHYIRFSISPPLDSADGGALQVRRTLQNALTQSFGAALSHVYLDVLWVEHCIVMLQALWPPSQWPMAARVSPRLKSRLSCPLSQGKVGRSSEENSTVTNRGTIPFTVRKRPTIQSPMRLDIQGLDQSQLDRRSTQDRMLSFRSRNWEANMRAKGTGHH